MNKEQWQKRVEFPYVFSVDVSVSTDLDPICFKQKQGVTFVRLRSCISLDEPSVIG